MYFSFPAHFCLQFGNQSVLNFSDCSRHRFLWMLKTFTQLVALSWCTLVSLALHVWWSLYLCLLTLSCISDHSPGHGGHGQHRQGLAGEPRQVRPLARRQPVAGGWAGRLGEQWDPHSHCGGLPHLQLQVGAQLTTSLLRWPDLAASLTTTFHSFSPAGLSLTSMTSVSTFPFPMRSANTGEGNELTGRLQIVNVRVSS